MTRPTVIFLILLISLLAGGLGVSRAGGSEVAKSGEKERCVARMVVSPVPKFRLPTSATHLRLHLESSSLASWVFSAVHHYLFDGISRIDRRSGADPDTAPIDRRYYPQGEQRLEGSTWTAYNYCRDHLGSVREVVKSDGTLAARYDFDPYGQRLPQYESPAYAANGPCDLAFTGHITQPSPVPGQTELTLAHYRAYDPELGRWLSPDPIGLTGGEANLYRYVRNSTTDRIDPLGLLDWSYDGNLLLIKVPFWRFWDRGFKGTGYDAWCISPEGAKQILREKGEEEALLGLIAIAVVDEAFGRDDSSHDNFDKAREAAQGKCGHLGEDTIKEYDPETGTLVGEKSKDGKRGWRNDPDHFNWWDWTLGKKGKGGRFGHELFPPEQGGPCSPRPSQK